VEDASPIRQRAIPYNRKERKWINDYMGAQEELHIVKRIMPGEEEPTFIAAVVLVKGG
jgi:hypothetical protein